MDQWTAAIAVVIGSVLCFSLGAEICRCSCDCRLSAATVVLIFAAGVASGYALHALLPKSRAGLRLPGSR